MEKTKKISFLHPASLIGTFLCIGKIPFAPGTWGSVGGVVFLGAIVFYIPAIISRQMPDASHTEVWELAETIMPYTIFAVTVLIYIIGAWATSVYMKHTGKHDPKEIVIDEVAGIFVMMSVAMPVYKILLSYDHTAFNAILGAYNIYFFIAGLLLFRLFDIWKPWPVGWIDRNMKGAHGVMLDDVAAGVMAAIAFYIIVLALYFSGGFYQLLSITHPDWVE